MGSKEILQVVELFSNEKGIPKSIVFDAIEQALATATRKRFEEEEADIRVAIDRSTGEYDTFRRWVVVPDDHLAILGSELTTEEAAEIDPSLNVGDEYEIEVESSEFGRIEAQTAKQVIVQKVREAEREKVVADYESRLMSLINGSVKKVTRDSVIVDLGGAAEALLPRENLIGREIFRVNDRVRAILQEIRTEGIKTIQYATEIDRTDYMIAPLLLITIIENAFKHSVIDSLIDLKISVKDGALECVCTNVFDATKETAEDKIGLQNLKKRLELIYKDHYEFMISTDEKYCVTLKLKLI